MNENRITFAIIKSGAVKRMHGSGIINALKLHGFVILAQLRMKLTEETIREFYAEHVGKPYFKSLMISVGEEVVPLVLTNIHEVDSIGMLRRIIGSTNSSEAEVGTIRNLYGGYKFGKHAPIADNAIHASDSPAAVIREMGIILPGLYEPIRRAIE